jgi:hypothetical protein
MYNSSYFGLDFGELNSLPNDCAQELGYCKMNYSTPYSI